MRKTCTGLAVLFVAAACVQYTLVEPGRLSMGDAFTVEPDIAWSRDKRGDLELWTVDGPALESLSFWKGLRDGEVLFAPKDPKKPAFREHMSPSDVTEIVVDSIAGSGAGQVEATGLRPADFGSLVGFRFELSYLTPEGLAMRAIAHGVVSDGRLYLILFTAARLHYYAKYEPHVEHLLESLEFQ